MKTGFFYLTIICALLLSIVYSAGAQEEQKVSKNPFPLSNKKKQEILEKSKKIIQKYTAMYPDSNLVKWPEAARDSFLIAKGTKINVLFAPDFYRECNKKPEVTREIGDVWEEYLNKPYYEIRFFYDTTKEKFLVGDDECLFNVHVWEENGQAIGFIVATYFSGDAFDPPFWEDGKYKNWQEREFHPFSYRTGYENPGVLY